MHYKIKNIITFEVIENNEFFQKHCYQTFFEVKLIIPFIL